MRALLTMFLLLLGALLMVLAGVGLLRLPDLFMRMQAATKASALGGGCILLAVAVDFAELGVTTRVVLIITFIFLTAPVSAHMIGRAAYSVGVPLWAGTVIDELRDQRPVATVDEGEAQAPDRA